VLHQLFAQGRPLKPSAEMVGGLSSKTDIKNMFVSGAVKKSRSSALLFPILLCYFVLAFNAVWAVPFRCLLHGLSQGLLVARAFLGRT